MLPSRPSAGGNSGRSQRRNSGIYEEDREFESRRSEPNPLTNWLNKKLGSGDYNEMGANVSTPAESPRSQGQRPPADLSRRKVPDLPRVSEVEIQRREEIMHYKNIIADLSGKNQSLEHELRQLQVKSFSQMTDAKYTPLEDSAIKLELARIQSAITSIGKTYGADYAKRLKDQPEKNREQLYRQLTLVVNMENATTADLEDDLVNVERAPQMMLTGLLSWTVHQKIIANPFFFLADENLERLEAKTRPAEMDWPEIACRVYFEEWKNNPNEANIWRSQTLRFLFPAPDEAKEPSELRRQIKAKRLTAGRLYADSFVHGVSKLLLSFDMDNPEFKRYQEEVETVFDKATAFSVTVWRQRVALRCSHMNDLAKVRFSIDSPELQAHPIHLLDDPSDHRLDGKLIRQVVHPAVRGLGTHEADKYDSTSRIWSKAVVILDP